MWLLIVLIYDSNVFCLVVIYMYDNDLRIHAPFYIKKCNNEMKILRQVFRLFKQV